MSYAGSIVFKAPRGCQRQKCCLVIDAIGVVGSLFGREFTAASGQKALQMKCASIAKSSKPPMPQIQNKKFAVSFGELISFLSIV